LIRQIRAAAKSFQAAEPEGSMQIHTGAVAPILSTVRGRNRPCQRVRLGCRAAALLLRFLMVACQSFGKRDDCDGCADAPPAGPRVPLLARQHTVHAMAHDLDHLQWHIDWYGSVVAKAPDVWGQARLTKHRGQFEKTFESLRGDFKVNLQGAIARSDQTYFANAFALSAAIQPKGKAGGAVGLLPDTRNTVVDTVEKTETGGEVKTKSTTNEKAASAPTAPTAPSALGAEKLINTDPDKLFTASTLSTKTTFADATKKIDGIGLEPTIVLEQHARYLNYLDQFRRTNEGDDIADSPGYSLNLVRVPVSVLPGKRTDVGFGAEITMTLTPILGPELLETTFRRLVINDLITHLGLPMTNFLDRADEPSQYLTSENREGVRGFDVLDQFDGLSVEKAKQKVADLSATDVARLVAAIRMVTPSECRPCAKLPTEPCKPEDLTKARRDYATEYFSGSNRTPATTRNQKNKFIYPSARSMPSPGQARTFVRPSIPFSNGLLARQPFPTSQLLDVYGLQTCFEIAYGAREAFKDEIETTKYVHLPNIQTYLREELIAAYQFLRTHETLWCHCTEDLAKAVKGQNMGDLETRQRAFRAAVFNLHTTAKTPNTEPLEFGKSAALAWCILVDSALLADRLMQETKETASAKKANISGAGQWLQYYLPNPPDDARRAFEDYVKVRWPVRVFALDPVTQDQNIADALSTEREMQLALSLAFTSGAVGAQNFTRLARRLEAQYETVALNRTQVGFGHGENTFGWRFYPRFQTPDTASALTAFVRDTIVGGPNRNQVLRDQRLEPGQRECVAIVLMPSFVPYLSLDTVSNWFPLTNPKHKVLDHTQAMKLSRTVQTLKCGGAGVTDACDYRPGELDRLVRRVDQLEARLPTQTQTVQVPQLNTLGGFEMFHHGISDLAPQLYGFYGAPGIRDDVETTLFLVGDHFSVLNTRVLVGNAEAKNKEMMSRQVMKVTVPAGVQTVKYDDGPYARIHIATPYGVSTELEVPVMSKAAAAAAAPKPGFAFNGAKLVVSYTATGLLDQPGRFVPEFKENAPKQIELTWTAPAGVTAKEFEVTMEFGAATPKMTVPCKGGTLKAKFDVRGRLVLEAAACELIAKDLIAQIAARELPKFEANPFAKPFVTTKVALVPVTEPGLAAQPALTNDQLTIEFQEVGKCPPQSKGEPPKETPKEKSKETPKEKSKETPIAVPEPLPPVPLPALPK
jgi:hypothetical protein